MSERDVVLDGYGGWLNDLLFKNKGVGEEVFWIGDQRWAVFSVEGPDIFVIELRRGKLVV